MLQIKSHHYKNSQHGMLQNLFQDKLTAQGSLPPKSERASVMLSLTTVQTNATGSL